ncbi:ABC transporter ATP-binding protein [Acuticoccus sediminis]|uniref:ABC transporter ATP-binding protein n=1 Tax=Acuticoccus sediminis TaxID=2184697 RepID=UPI001CFD0C8E|nr:ABC transporter ATP-binding protein [Acuticoccus sediminis]
MTDGSPTPAPVLSVRDLVIDVATPDGTARIVNNVSFDVPSGGVFSVVGESGSGKSITMLALMGLLDSASVSVTGGTAMFEGRDLLALPEAELMTLRGTKVAMIFQDPMTSFNPVITIGRQIEEMIAIHDRTMSPRARRDRSIELLDLVGVPDPARRVRQYPHAFSGGMRQRAMIAMAVANTPKLLIADEPTTALDVTIQAQVMEVLAKVREETGAAMILVTHDLGLVAEYSDDVGVMYGGRMMERAAVDPLFEGPRHPYTIGLLNSIPRHDTDMHALSPIPGQPPAVGEHPSGCVFHPRCGLSRGRTVCAADEPALRPVGAARLSACHFVDEIDAWSAAGAPPPEFAPGVEMADV